MDAYFVHKILMRIQIQSSTAIVCALTCLASSAKLAVAHAADKTHDQIERICRETESLKSSAARNCAFFYKVISKAESDLHHVEDEVAATNQKASSLKSAPRSCPINDEFAKISEAYGLEQDELRGQRNLLDTSEIENYLNGAFKKLPASAKKDRVRQTLQMALGKLQDLKRKLQPEMENLLTKIKAREGEVAVARLTITDLLSCPQSAPQLPLRVSPNLIKTPSQEELTPIERLLRFAVFKFIAPRSSGTGFRVVAMNLHGESRYLIVTAYHVAAEDSTDPNNTRLFDIESVPAGSTQKTGLIEPFSTGHSQYERTFDVILRGDVPGPALELASKGDEPQIGQKIEIAGHPVGFNNRYVNAICTFVGYGAAAPIAGFYVLDCPTGDKPMGGASGGPAVDIVTGRVIGILVDQGADREGLGADDIKNTGKIFVSPIHGGNNGSLLLGSQVDLTSDNCFDLLSSTPRKCSVHASSP